MPWNASWTSLRSAGQGFESVTSAPSSDPRTIGSAAHTEEGHRSASLFALERSDARYCRLINVSSGQPTPCTGGRAPEPGWLGGRAGPPGAARASGRDGRNHFRLLPPALREAVERQVDDGRGEQREELRDEQPAHDGDAERPPQLATHAVPERERQPSQHRRQGGHEDGAEAQEARLVD